MSETIKLTVEELTSLRALKTFAIVASTVGLLLGLYLHIAETKQLEKLGVIT